MSDKPRGPLAQIATGVLVALLVGGSVPWWWSDLKARFTSHSSQPTEQQAAPAKPSPQPTEESPPPTKPTAPAETYSQAEYDAVQALYDKRKTARSCEDVKRLIAKIREYFGNEHLVPPNYVETVRYPSPVPKPTISDLAKDRIARIRDARPKCFP